VHSLVYLIILLVDGASIAGAVRMGHPAQEFFEEGRFITWLSCIHLAVTAGISLCSLITVNHLAPPGREKTRRAGFWGRCCLGFLYLCADEWYLIHANLDFITNDYYLYRFVTDNRALDEEIGMVLGTVEDSLKLLAEGVLMIAFLEGFRITLKQYGASPPPRPAP